MSTAGKESVEPWNTFPQHTYSQYVYFSSGKKQEYQSVIPHVYTFTLQHFKGKYLTFYFTRFTIAFCIRAKLELLIKHISPAIR